MVNKFQARHATLSYDAGAVTWDTSTTIDAESFDADVAEVKDITLTTPEHAVEQIPCLGNLTQTIGANVRTAGTATGIVPATWQVMALQATSLSNWKMEGTLVMTGTEQFQQILGLDSGTTINSTDQRYAVGNLASAKAFAKNHLGSVRVFFNNGSQTTSVGMSNSFVTKIGDIKPTGSDGHFEVDFSVECLPKDGALEIL